MKGLETYLTIWIGSNIAGFPFSKTVIFAAYFILKRDDFEYLWHFNHPFKNRAIKMMEPE